MFRMWPIGFMGGLTEDVWLFIHLLICEIDSGSGGSNGGEVPRNFGLLKKKKAIVVVVHLEPFYPPYFLCRTQLLHSFMYNLKKESFSSQMHNHLKCGPTGVILGEVFPSHAGASSSHFH